MLIFLFRRLLVMIPTLILVSILCFTVITIQPGSFLNRYLEDPRVSPQTVERITEDMGLNRPAWQQYVYWIGGIVTRGDFGHSFSGMRPVSTVIFELLGWTVIVAGLTMIFAWVVAIPLGIITALKRNGFTDFIASFFGYIGLAVPDFLIALLLVFAVLNSGGTQVGGLFSPEFIGQPWSWARFVDLMQHLWIPIIAIGTNSVASIMRQMRANLLDVLNADYVRTARAKGVPERTVIMRHAVRTAINPLVSLAGLSLPDLINGTIIASIVLNLPTIGPLLYDSLLNKDQYVSMALLLFSSILLMAGNLLADLALAWVDPRIRYA